MKRAVVILFLLFLSVPEVWAQAQATAQRPFEPQVGQAGKDVVWVPTSPELLSKMLDMAKVTPQDYVVDLGSGDGRNIIAAAKRGATARGFEYNPDMVELSRRMAREAGVADKATFVEGDMYEAEFSNASVLALFLLPQNLEKLREKFLALKPGSRLVLNTFAIPEWEPDEREELDSSACQSWCTSLLYIVPAKASGTWRLPQGELTLTQQYQNLKGTLRNGSSTTEIASGRMRGEQITFSVNGVEYTGRLNGNRIEGMAGREKWTATREN
jgi:SAM-dependent methyltransferase